MDIMDIPADYVEIDPTFEPLSRARSNTWPLRPVEVSPDSQNSPGCEEIISHDDQSIKEATSSVKGSKSSARRNAWGNLSYADLITKAIQSTAEQRLTLSQIYDWMVQNVPFFHDKGESNSSAGWKNSIRHNLSLHNRFMRMPNEAGAGKSSWWVINPEAKHGKTQRSRRANSMETKTMEKKRFKARKRVEALRAMEANASPTRPSDDRYHLSPSDPGPFRDRASSNASTLSGRLSPIPAFDRDLDEDVRSWGSNSNIPGAYMSNDPMQENLVDSLMDSMRLVDGNIGLALTPEENMIPEESIMSDTMYSSMPNSMLYNFIKGSPSHNDLLSHSSPLYRDTQNISPPTVNEMRDMSPQEMCPANLYEPSLSKEPQLANDLLLISGQNLQLQKQLSPDGSPLRSNYLSSNTGVYQRGSPSLSPNGNLPSNMSQHMTSPQLSPHYLQLSPSEVRKLILHSSTKPLLRAQLAQIPPQHCSTSPLLKILTDRTNSQLTQLQIQQLKLLNKRKFCEENNDSVNNPGGLYHAQSMGSIELNPNIQSMSMLNAQSYSNLYSSSPERSKNTYTLTDDDPMLSQFRIAPDNAPLIAPVSNNPMTNYTDIDVDNLDGMHCDIDRVLNYELSLGGDLDFNFDPNDGEQNHVH